MLSPAAEVSLPLRPEKPVLVNMIKLIKTLDIFIFLYVVIIFCSFLSLVRRETAEETQYSLTFLTNYKRPQMGPSCFYSLALDVDLLCGYGCIPSAGSSIHSLAIPTC